MIRFLVALIAAVLSWGAAIPAWADSSKAIVFGETTVSGNVVEIRPAENPEKSGDLLLKALEGLDRPSKERPYLLKLGPGIYFLGKRSLSLRPFVSIEGAGPFTVIKGSISSEGKGLIIGANEASLKSLTIENRGKGPSVIGLSNEDASPMLSGLNIVAAGADECTYGIWNSSSSPSIDAVTVKAEGAAYNHGIFNRDSSPVMRNVRAEASGGQEAFALLNLYSTPLMNDFNGKASGASSFNVAVWNINSSPSIVRVSVYADGGDQNIGIYNSSSDPSMEQVNVNASGTPGTNYGIRNIGSRPVILNSSVMVYGHGYGVHNASSSPVLINVMVSATGGIGPAIGLYNAGEGNRVRADRCNLKGKSQSVFCDTLSSVELGGCFLDGAVGGGGSFHCAFCYGTRKDALDFKCR